MTNPFHPERLLKGATFSPPAGVRSASKRALEWIKDGKAGSGFTDVGRRRASQLANGQTVSEDTIRRMKAYFDRHQSDKKATGFRQGEDGFPSAGRVAWEAWGGDAGYSWAKEVVARLNRQDEVAKRYKVIQHGTPTYPGTVYNNFKDPKRSGDWAWLGEGKTVESELTSLSDLQDEDDSSSEYGEDAQ